MDTFFGVLIFGILFVIVGEFYSRLNRKNSTDVDRLIRLSNMTARNMNPASDEPSVTVTKAMLEEMLLKANKKSFPPILQNFCWFSMGSVISVFANDIRSMIGL